MHDKIESRQGTFMFVVVCVLCVCEFGLYWDASASKPIDKGTKTRARRQRVVPWPVSQCLGLPFVDQLVIDWVTRLTFHYVRFGGLVSQRNGRHLFVYVCVSVFIGSFEQPGRFLRVSECLKPRAFFRTWNIRKIEQMRGVFMIRIDWYWKAIISSL